MCTGTLGESLLWRSGICSGWSCGCRHGWCRRLLKCSRAFGSSVVGVGVAPLGEFPLVVGVYAVTARAASGVQVTSVTDLVVADPCCGRVVGHVC